ncbi:NR2E1 [Lepeophtheirus salmonis]|uniref:NR2E1 n=1 Tax=Lepeophtheirus salmonis TaxID=72036 RepID=A0A7R8CR85_LEPSM|nr:NR2E1 [Lepeophtheirus salmonis]CAF2852349.1 NR2E1 [Lepeophtheirus salmonis]
MLFQPQLHSPPHSSPEFGAKSQQTSSRILYDIPCKVCTDHSSGKHYGIFACDGCAGFFKRSIRRNRLYVCKAKSEGSCLVDKTHRNQCRACRLKRCVDVGMNKDAVQHERGPRNSTLRRQMSLYFKEHSNNNTTTVSSESGSPRSSPPINSTLPQFQGIGGASVSSSSSPPLLFTSPHATSPGLDLSPYSKPLIHFPLPLSYPPLHHPLPPPPMPALPLPFNFFPSPYAPPTFHTSGLRNPENVSETAARLLFMNVHQLLLLEESWRELFLLSSAQFNLPVELVASQDKSISVLSELKNFQEAIAKFQSMQVDTTEFACLRAIILFKTVLEEEKELRDTSSITSLQDQAQLTLSKYISSAYPGQPMRFGKLLLLLPSLRSVSGNVIEELFFKKNHRTHSN